MWDEEEIEYLNYWMEVGRSISRREKREKGNAMNREEEGALWLSVEDAAKKAGVSKASIYRLIEEGMRTRRASAVGKFRYYVNYSDIIDNKEADDE